MSKTVVILEPAGEIYDFLTDAKARVIATSPKTIAYAAHPPHCTLVFGEYGDPVPWLRELEAAVAKVPAFNMSIQGWQTFEADALAGGGDTLALAIEPDAALFNLQEVVAEVATGMTEEPDIEDLPEGIRVDPFASSWAHFGCPFVGYHWIPHATVASFPMPETRELLEVLRAQTVAFHWPVSEVVVCDVVGDDHLEIGRFSLLT